MIHRRLVANSKTLFDTLDELGYEKFLEIGQGLKKEVTYRKNGKYVKVSQDSLKLYYFVGGKEKVAHVGLSVHDELLTFFTQRDYGHDKTSV